MFVVATQELGPGDMLLRFKAETSQNDKHSSRCSTCLGVADANEIFLLVFDGF